jgi:Mg-chelatase subunit ChlD
MKTKLISLAIFAATATTVALYPAYQSVGAIAAPTDGPAELGLPPFDPTTNERPVVEVVFVLDTTGSMAGLIQAAKDKIWSIASTLASAQPAPQIRMGLVAYRDRGDAYVTRVVDLSADLDAMQAQLIELQASGGGDGPESVNQALHDAVHRIGWSDDPRTYRVVFLVGDAPPHMDYQDDVKYPETLALARQKGIAVNAVQCGQSAGTTQEWQRIARLGEGKYFRVDQDGGAVAITTPYDGKLARLSAELDATRLYYGSAEDKAEQARKLAVTEKVHAESSVASRARRATFAVSPAGKAGLAGEKELVEDVASGRVDLTALDAAALPAPLQSLAPAERKAVVEDQAARRKALAGEMTSLAAERDAYIKRQVAARGGAKDSLDDQIYGAVRAQAAAKGLKYEAAAPAY